MSYSGIAATAAQMKELDRIAIEERGVPSLDLMEQAATAVADAVEQLLTPDPMGPTATCSTVLMAVPHQGESITDADQAELDRLQDMINDPAQKGRRVAVFCGPGNNGGDGIAAARLLLQRGFSVRAVLVGDRRRMTADARAMEQRLRDCGGTLEDFCPTNQEQMLLLSICDCKVDALFGVGLSRPITGDAALAVRLLQTHAGGPVVSCDIPSGIHADTGAVLGCAVHAAITVTFSCPKPGHYLGDGAEHTGDLWVADIGLPFDLLCHQPVPLAVVGGSFTLPRRKPNSHKGDYGRLLIVGGSEGYTGAPVLAASAALRSGAGLVFVAVPRNVYPIVAGRCSAAMALPLPDSADALLDRVKGCSAALIGPGLGRDHDDLVRMLLQSLDCPVILDADGLNAAAGHLDWIRSRTAPTVLTPHDGEFARLTGCALPIGDRLDAARSLARNTGAIVILKGHRTVTAAPDGRTWINTSGNAGMATGGSGDTLAGILAAFLGQKPLYADGADAAQLAARAVWLHGAAGDHAARRLGEYSLLPDGLIDALPQVLRDHIAD
ncbi:NAD(P)H-hydrate dehydratase [Candidatus Avoscillospira sp. LCP25S3_F1]|uniref:NAD(P)H-hydrate dehydratase n=1 Tax=Candidatus Avoscillospira sp. LCP25S3_F1 TaxID=3438825 RepID=UPI003F8F192C